MDSQTGGLICTAICWGVALLVGTFAGTALMVLGDWWLLQAIFAGTLIFIAVGALVSLTVCRPMPGLVKAGSAGVKPETSTAAAAPAPATPKPAPPKPAPPKPAAAKPAAPAPASAVQAGEESRPAALDGPRDGGADDLKRIKGIGPKLEILCNSLGFYHFDQIAAWTAEEVAWVDQNLEGFKGRVTRDTWVEQARLLAAGGETEFSRKVDGGDVY